VLQNGIEDMGIPWDGLAAVFIGGDDRFKTCNAVWDIVRTAKAMGIWVHMGRVNTADRVEKALEMGCDSIDGTGLARYSHMRHGLAGLVNHPKLFEVAQ